MSSVNDIQKAKDYIKSILGTDSVKTAVILGSGLSDIAQSAQHIKTIPYSDIPGFPLPTVPGHRGQLVYGNIKGRDIIFMQGRFHYYEGHSPQTVVFPIRVLKLLGVSRLIITNAAGGVNLNFAPGDIMLISDHINLTGINPLIGAMPQGFENRFVDMTNAYDKNLLDIALSAAAECKTEVKTGIYIGMAGPSYETPAEVKFLRTIGGDAVGMSTVNEVIAARQAQIKVLGISLITNYAAGIKDISLSHKEVTEASVAALPALSKLISEIIGKI